MMDLQEEFVGVITALQKANIEFAVCGGFAMALHGFPRFTKDIDLLVRQEDVERVVAVVHSCGFDFDAGTMRFGANTPRRQDVRRVNKIVGPDFLVLDLLIVGAHLEDVWSLKKDFVWQDLSIPAISAAGLAKMKLVAGRPQDLVDIERLGFKLDDPAIQS